MTPSAPTSHTSAPFHRALPALIAAAACALLLGLSVMPPSTTRLQVWPWAAFAAFGWLLPIAVAVWRLALGRPFCRFGGLVDAGFGLLALAAVASALASPLRGAVAPHLLPVLGALALPYALLPALKKHAAVARLALAVVSAAILAVGLPYWTPGSRNTLPFGHANITGSVAVLAALWCAACAAGETRRAPRAAYAAGLLFMIAVALTSVGRGAVIALAAAGTAAAAIALLRRRRFIMFAALALALALAAVIANPGLRDLAFHGRWSPSFGESNDQRTAMILGGLHLGVERPLLGWGAGAVPHVFPRVRADLPGTADNFLQLHNTPAQLWATLGSAGFAAAALIAAGVAARARRLAWTPEQVALAAGVVGAATMLLFDHPFATPAFAVLAAALLSAWLTSASRMNPPSDISAWARISILVIGSGALAFTLTATARDLAARHAYDQALDKADRGDAAGYADRLRLADMLSPGDPYYAHLLAAQLATGHPFAASAGGSHRTAVTLLERTLETNPDLEYARYNLGWLLLGSDPETAARHFTEAIRLAPKRGGVYLGLGLARIRCEDTDGAVRAFAAEWLLDPATAWTTDWTQGPLAALAPRVRALATAAAIPLNHGSDPWMKLSTPAPAGQPYRRVRTGYGVLMGHPDGAPPVDFNIRARAELPPEVAATVPPFGWIEAGALLDFLRSN